MKYKHLFFDLDHTLWDFDSNSRQTLWELFHAFSLQEKGVNDFDLFHKLYLLHNDKLWAQYREGAIKPDDLKWKRMWLTLMDFKVGDELLAREMGLQFLKLLPLTKTLFPDTVEMLQYLTDKGYHLHLITNGFESTQHHKLQRSGIDKFFLEVITSEGSNRIKPDREIFNYAVRRVQARCQECIMIGDSIEADIKGAKNAGMDQVFVNHLNIQPDMEPTFTIYALKELQTIF